MGRELTGDERAKKVEGRAFEFFSKTLEMADKQRTEDKEREEAKKRRLEESGEKAEEEKKRPDTEMGGSYRVRTQ